MNKIKKFDIEDEDKLLDSVILWVESDEELHKGGKWIYPKGARKKLRKEK